jgi:hypothetical protein
VEVQMPLASLACAGQKAMFMKVAVYEV